MRARSLIGAIVAVTTLSTVGASPVRATFPGSDGRIVMSYEAPVPGEHLTQTDLYSMNPDGTGLRRLTDTPHKMEFMPSWNAPGTKVVFSRTRAPFGPGSIWVMDADGGNPVRLTSDIDARDPVWSPDGRRIAITRFTDRGPDIWTIRASDGAGRRRVTSWPSLEFQPAWSPDGQSIAFTRGFATGDMGDMWAIDLVSRETTHVTTGTAYDNHASWSPDGGLILFQRGLIRYSKIAVVQPDGTGLHVLTSGHYDGGAVYSPSGTRIAFDSDRRSTFLPDLWVMQSDGTALRRIRDLPWASTQPNWQALPVV